MFASLILALLCASPEWPAGLDAMGVIEGATTSDGGAALPGVKIAIDGLAKPVHLETLSNAAGRYEIGNVPPGA